MRSKFFAINLLYEFKKLPPVLWTILISILVFINIFSACVSVNKIDIIDTEHVQKAINDYLIDPLSFTKSYDEWLVSYDLYEKALLESAKSSNEMVCIAPPEQIYNSQIYDYQLYDKLFSLLYRKDTYTQKISDLLDTAERNVSSSAMNSFAKKYNEKILQTYSNTSANIHIGIEDTRGWDIYLESPIPGLSTMLILIFICGYLFCLEYSTGMNGIIFSSCYGKGKIFSTKLICLLLLSFLFLLLSEGVTLFVIYKIVGLSSPWNSIQAFSQYTYCPFIVSVFTYAILSFIAKLVVIGVLCVFTAVLSVFFQKIILVYILYTVSTIVAYISLLVIPNVGSLAYRIHPFIHLTSTDFFKRYSASNIFGNVGDHFFLVPILYCLSVIFLLRLLFLKNIINKPFHNVLFKFPKIVIRKHSLFPPREYTLLLTPHELKKQLQQKSILLCIFFLIVQTAFTYTLYSGDHSAIDDILHEYLLLLEGPISSEKTDFLLNERKKFDVIFSSKESIELSYSNGEINNMEYLTYLQDYERALSHSDVLDRVIQYNRYLNHVSLEKEKPAYFLYFSGYENLLNSGNDILMLLLIFFLATEVFSCEYTNKTSTYPAITLIYSTKYGRKKTTTAKYICSFIITSILYLCFSSLRLIILSYYWYFPALSAPLYSLEQFKNAPDISILIFLIFYFWVRLIFILLLVSFILAITKKTKNGHLVFSFCSIWLLCPYICEYFDFSFPRWLNFNYIYNNLFI